MTASTQQEHFPTQYADVLKRIETIDPVKYASTRNYKNGAVTRLSPYISRGVISTKQVLQHIQTMDLPWYKIEKFVQELAWREYWQNVWLEKGEDINTDLRHPQEQVESQQLPEAMIQHRTGINAIDSAIEHLYNSGYMHNHMRMYVAALATNIAHTHWKNPATWMYSHLLDGDWASNTLSWQWVAGSNANKKYIANQQNINRYFEDNQTNTFLDVLYDKLSEIKTPEILTSRVDLIFPPLDFNQHQAKIDDGKSTLIYNYYNLDPLWRKEENHQRVLLIEPSFFTKYPVTRKCLNFMYGLAQNIDDIKIFVGEFQQLKKAIPASALYYKEHPTARHYQGKEDSRDWMAGALGYYPSFFKFWKKAKSNIQ